MTLDSDSAWPGEAAILALRLPPALPVTVRPIMRLPASGVGIDQNSDFESLSPPISFSQDYLVRHAYELVIHSK